jgi:hypothetical protein
LLRIVQMSFLMLAFTNNIFVNAQALHPYSRAGRTIFYTMLREYSLFLPSNVRIMPYIRRKTAIFLSTS